MDHSNQFRCPACDTLLVVPMAAAGKQGPCPHCAEIITAARPQPPKPPASPPPLLARQSTTAGLPGGPYAAILVLSCLLAAVICFAGGFLLARLETLEGPLPLSPPSPANAPEAADIPAQSPPEANPSASSPSDPPLRTIDQSNSAATSADHEPANESATSADHEPANESPTTAATPEEAALRAFLTAPGWASRTTHVLTPDRVSEAMAAHAAKHGDGPIRFKEISSLQDSGKTRVFLVRTPAIPDGFPVVLSESNNGGWLVDWEGFIEFHDDAFRNFADKSPSGQQTFRLLVNPVAGQADAGGVIKYRLNPPMPARERVARVEDGSTSHTMLRQIFGTQEKSDPQTYRSLMADRGLPLIITVSKRPTQPGGGQLWIERVVAAGWNPANPKSE